MFDGGDHTPGGTSGSDDILVGDGKKVAFLNGEFLGLTGDLLHVGDHFIETLGLFGELGFVDERIAIHFDEFIGKFEALAWNFYEADRG